MPIITGTARRSRSARDSVTRRDLPIKAAEQRRADANLVDLDSQLASTSKNYQRWLFSGQVRERAWAERLRFLQNAVGAVPGPWDCWLVLRGRCRWCQTRFSVRYLLGEATVAVSSGAVMYAAFGYGLPLPPWMAAPARALPEVFEG